jgi:hypothetical protein
MISRGNERAYRSVRRALSGGPGDPGDSLIKLGRGGGGRISSGISSGLVGGVGSPG